MERKFEELNEKLSKLIEKLENKEIVGPISLLEEAQQIIIQALEEYQYYLEDLQNEDNYEL